MARLQLPLHVQFLYTSSRIGCEHPLPESLSRSRATPALNSLNADLGQKYGSPRRVSKCFRASQEPKPLARRASHKFSFCDDDFSELVQLFDHRKRNSSGRLQRKIVARKRGRVCLQCTLFLFTVFDPSPEK